MRAEVLDLGGACGEDDRADQPCGSASSDSNSNGDVKAKKPNGVTAASPNGRSAKQPIKSPSGGGNSSGLENVSPGWTQVHNPRQKKFTERQSKRMAAMLKSKRKAGGGDKPLEDNNHHHNHHHRQQQQQQLPEHHQQYQPDTVVSSDDSDDDDITTALPGPSNAQGVAFGYEPTKVVPWSARGYYPLSIVGLHAEIVDCWQWLKPSRLETAVRYKVYEKVRTLIEHYWQPVPVRVSVFGSLRTRLFLPSSDIDVLVECDEWLHYTDEEMKTEVMQKTLMCLQLHLEKVSFHPTAFVPIIKLVDPDTKLNIDISFNTVQGVKAATYMAQVKAEFPVLEPLLLLLKQYIFQNKLHEAYSGGLSSYGISLMLVNFFQIHHPNYRRRQPEGYGVNLGYLLMRFFEVYGHELNYSAVAIDPSINRYRKRSSECSRPAGSEADADAPDADDASTAATTHSIMTEVDDVRDNKMKKTPILLSVHDPLQEGNEVCRSSFNIYSVRTLFQSALVQLRAVFVRDRPGSIFWREKVYRGTMLGRLLHFSPSQINFRYWLKGFVLSSRDPEVAPAKTSNGKPLILYGSLLSDPSDMTMLSSFPKALGRALEIKRPDETYTNNHTNPSSISSSISSGRNDKSTNYGKGWKREENSGGVEENKREEEMKVDQWELQQQLRARLDGGLDSMGRTGKSGGGGQAYVNGGYYNGHVYPREWRNSGGRGPYHQYYNSQLHHAHQHSQPRHNQQHQQQSYGPGSYQSRTWERPAAGYGRRVLLHDDRTKSRSSEMLSEHSATSHGSNLVRPPRHNSPLILHPQQQQQPTASVAATMSYKRSDSAVSSCSTTVLGNGSLSTLAITSSSVSTPAINSIPASTTATTTTTAPAAGAAAGAAAAPTATVPTSNASTGRAPFVRRCERLSGRCGLYMPPAARKAAEAAAASGAAAAAKKKEASVAAAPPAAPKSGREEEPSESAAK